MTRTEISEDHYLEFAQDYQNLNTGRVEVIAIKEGGICKLQSVTWLPDGVINDSARGVVFKDGKYWHVVGNSLRGDDA